jgi:GDP-L-fucose synthase
MKKILVTGANGLLGMALRRVLGPGHVYHTRAECDLLDYTSTYNYFKTQVEVHGVDSIIHAAARVGGVKANSENNSAFFYENYYISNNVIKVAYELNIKNFVNVLSTCIFPDQEVNYPLTPDQIDNGRPHDSNYGYSYAKRLSGYETKIFADITKNNWFSVVATNLYGPYDNFNLDSSHLIPGMIHRAYLAKQHDTPFVVWGDGYALRQFMYAEDLATLIIDSLYNWNQPNHCMLVNEEEVSVRTIALIVCDKFKIPHDQIIYDTDKPKGQLRKPATSYYKDFKFKPLRDGIYETIDWFTNNYDIARK